MRVVVSVDGEGLVPWLAEDPVTREADIVPAARAGEMGAGEIVHALLQDTASLGSLVVAVLAWRDSHRGGRQPLPEVRFEREGAVVTVTAGDPADVERIVQALNEPRSAP
ncbi:hypothetical protein ACFWIO_22255 [Streptomyces diastatochromogenes]|uniref:effector-associated constant component EACC1 n=1 Tax=Streptomyces diastatochromogenes TaxID=42236 RepID=UPI0036514F58